MSSVGPSLGAVSLVGPSLRTSVAVSLVGLSLRTSGILVIHPWYLNVSSP